MSLTYLIAILAVANSIGEGVELDYHQLKELRETMIRKNDRTKALFEFYHEASKNYNAWTPGKPEHLQRRPKTNDEVWFFNEEELWWQTGVVANTTRFSGEHGVWSAQVSPTQWRRGSGYTEEFMNVIYPDKKRVSWQSQKACDIGTLQEDLNDAVMGKRLFNIAKAVDENNNYAYLGLARWHIERKEWNSAYEMCEKAIELEKRWFLPYMYKGIIKRHQAQADGAKDVPGLYRISLRHFKEAMELNPSSIEAINNLARFYYYVDKNHRKSCFWHRVLNTFVEADTESTTNLESDLSDHIAECDLVQSQFDKQEL